MRTKTEISKKNKYWISKHVFVFLKAHCMRYNEWKDEYNALDGKRAVNYDPMPGGSGTGDPTFQIAARRAELKTHMQVIENTAKETDPILASFILKGVTDDRISFDYLQAVLGIPCSRRTYFRLRRRFFWLLSQKIVITYKIEKLART